MEIENILICNNSITISFKLLNNLNNFYRLYRNFLCPLGIFKNSRKNFNSNYFALNILVQIKYSQNIL